MEADVDQIDAVFGPGGALSRAFPGYAPRPPQVEFARAWAEQIEARGVLMAEAGTGTGKSVAYLVPAIQAVQEARATGKVLRVVVVTSNISLQEQLVKKDLPMLQRVLPEPFTFALAKGFSNYACRESLDGCDPTQVRLGGGEDPTADLGHGDREQLREAMAWAKKSVVGDISELSEELRPKVRRLVTISSDECSGKKCAYFKGQCFPRNARNSFRNADVVVTNYHLYCIDLAVRHQGGPGVLPDHDLLVMDEAHELPAIAREYFGMRTGFFSVRAAVAELEASGKVAKRLELPRKIDPLLKIAAVEAAEQFFRECHVLRKSDRYKARLDRANMIGGQQLEALLGDAAKAYDAAAADPGLLDEAREFLRERASLCRRHAFLISDARQASDPDNVYFLEDKGESRTDLVMLPVSPAGFLSDALWPSPEERRGPSAILACSATLATDKGAKGFDFFAKQVGIEQAGEIIVDSPFDYSRVAFVVPEVEKTPDNPAFPDVAAEVLVDVVRRAGGRTLALFTSYRGIEAAHRALMASGLPYKFMRQGEAPRTKLVEMFKAEETSVLLGTESFWTGVDVPGPALSALFIDKLPFPRMDDPVMDVIKARSLASGSKWGWFDEHYIPEAIVKFKQGFGRLVRSVDDYGAVVCCDDRIYSKGYGKRFRRALPPDVFHSRSLSELDRVLARYRGAA